jgi:ectoine hydroxylase-related dioxygenase (phytanoyl-CoA dioxygenase family)
MATLRVHVDIVDEENAPLQVVTGSHKRGPLSDEEVQGLADAGEVITCTAQIGDVWAYSTPIVHASAEQRKPNRRRVLQVDYSSDDLPGGLEWQTLV